MRTCNEHSLCPLKFTCQPHDQSCNQVLDIDMINSTWNGTHKLNIALYNVYTPENVVYVNILPPTAMLAGTGALVG